MRKFLLAAVFVTAFTSLHAQTLPPAEPQSMPAFQSDAQRSAFDTAKTSYAARHYAEAYAALKDLHAALPDDIDLTRFTATAAIDSDHAEDAIALLKPIVDAKPGSWQELILLARAYAQTGDAVDRDSSFGKLVDLANSGRHPKLSATQAFLAERVAVPEGHVDIYYSLQPWSKYRVFESARFINAEGAQTYFMTLETDDSDQPIWAKEHPDLAAKGMRMFTMDGYSQPEKLTNGGSTFTHATFGFFDGRPTYEVFKQRVVQVATNKSAPMSKSQLNTAPPKQ